MATSQVGNNTPMTRSTTASDEAQPAQSKAPLAAPLQDSVINARPARPANASLLRGAVGALALTGGSLVEAVSGRHSAGAVSQLQRAGRRLQHNNGYTRVSGGSAPAWLTTVNENPLPEGYGVEKDLLGARWADYLMQPVIPENFIYATSMQAPMFEGTILEPGGSLTEGDSQQGNIPDCGIGASIIAVQSAGWTRIATGGYLFGIAKGAPMPYFDATLYAGVNQPAVMRIDDLLPRMSSTSTTGLWPFLGYQPATNMLNEAATNTSQNKVLYVPYMEKAFAKLLDAYPSLKPDPTLNGYAALSGINPGVVLTALTNRPVQQAARWDGTSLWQIDFDACMDLSVPCVVSTPSADELQYYGDYNAATQSVTLSPGVTLQHNTAFNDCLQLMNGDDVELTLVTGHAYAVLRGSEAPNLDRVVLSNPWGCNPDASTLCTQPQEITISRSWAQTLLAGVQYANN